MKNTPNRNKHKELTDGEVEAALHAALRDEGYLFPESAEDLVALEAKLNTSGVPTPDGYRFKQLLRRQSADATNKVVHFPNSARAVSANIEENLAIAARNGGSISKELRKQMDADRKNAQECRRRPKNVAH